MAAITHSTNDVPPQKSFEYWHDLVCGAFVSLDCSSPRRDAFTGSISSQSISSLSLTTMVSDRMDLVRSPQRIATAREDCFLVALEARTRSALEQDGSYILRAHVPWEQWPAEMEKQAPVLWEWYMQLVRVEESFKTLKSDLNLRPIHHQLEHRVEAHILVAFLGYCLTTTLRMKLMQAAPGLTPRAALQSLSAIQMVEVNVPTSDGRVLMMPRYTEPEAQQKLILEKLRLDLPPQPPLTRWTA